MGTDLGAFGSCLLLQGVCLGGGHREVWGQHIPAGAKSVCPDMALENK